MNVKFYARSLDGASEDQWQEVRDHLNNVAEEASGFAAVFGAAQWAHAAGLLHDLGKYSDDFQRRLRGGARVDHSTAGAIEACRLFGCREGKLLAYAIAGHHSGLLDGTGTNGLKSDLEKRLIRWRQVPPYGNFPPRMLEGLVKPTAPLKPLGRPGFQFAFFLRMVFSCLVDADRLDAERFTDPDKANWRGRRPDIDNLSEHLEAFLKELRGKADDSPLNKRRNEILDACLVAADQPPGLFSLTVPTGGGKTYSSLAFGLRHAKANGLRRVIYVIPYTSIIEQNARVMRQALGDEAVLEHHASLPAREDRDDDSAVGRRDALAAENWDAPLVVTTNVQFFESLFASKPGKCRKLHNIAGSVIILDEAQMLPRDCLWPCLAALKELVANYRCTVLLCTATQPALGDAATFKGLAMDPREIAPEPAKLYEEFRRVAVRLEGRLSDDELATRLAAHDQALCIVNTRRHARNVFRLLARACPEGGVYHLSSLMYPAHRLAKLTSIRQDLAAGRPCLVVSTQLVEAGVDVDFPHVYRAMAGLDSLAQAAGRCNREGRLPGLGVLHVFDYDPKEYRPLHSLISPAEEGRMILRTGQDPLSLPSIGRYFENLYAREKVRLDVDKILELLETGCRDVNFPFETVAGLFKYFDSPGEAVLVCPDKALREKIIDGLRYAPSPGKFLRLAQPYVVQLFPGEIARLEQRGAVIRIGEVGLPVLVDDAFYSDDMGLGIDLEASADPANLTF